MEPHQRTMELEGLSGDIHVIGGETDIFRHIH